MNLTPPSNRAARLFSSVLLLAFCGVTSTWASLIENYTGLTTAISNSAVVTGFLNGAIITVGAGQTIQITGDTVIDAGTANVVIDGGNATRLFNIHPGAQLTLANFQIDRGFAALGGAIYNQGTLIVTNCVFFNNNATNAPGLAGSNGTTNGLSGGSGGNGGSVAGGAIYSVGPLYIYNSVFTTNAAIAGAGGGGGNAVNVTGQLYAGSGGNGGNGGASQGGAIFSSGPTNFIYNSEFLANTCVAGPGGAGGIAGINAQFYYYDGASGQGGTGGAALGGGVYVTGGLTVSNCLFYNNAVFAGSSMAAASAFNGAGYYGPNGGNAVGGALYVSGASPAADIENSTFFENSCVSGAGGNSSGTATTAGSGGAANGGGIASGSASMFVRCCTLATNTLLAGAAGTASGTNGVKGATGAADGAQIYRGAGTTRVQSSLLAGPGGNTYSVSDAGYNISSDTTPGRLYPTTQLRTDPRLAADISTNGGLDVGPMASTQFPRLSLAIVTGSPAAQALRGVPGVSFPVVDELGMPRPANATIGAYEAHVLTPMPSAPPQITVEPSSPLAALGHPAELSATVVANPDDTNALGYQWQLNGFNLIESATVLGVNTPSLTLLNLSQSELGAYTLVVGPSVLDSVTNSTPAYLLVDIPTVIRQQPASRLNIPDGSLVQFKVLVSGSPPFYYQWLLNGAPLSDTNEFSGSSSNELTINPATDADAGTYSVIITNFLHSVTSANARLTIVNDNTKPKLSITTPAINARTTTPVVAGFATDNAQVTSVTCWITNIFEGMSTVTETNAALTAGGTSKAWAVSNIFLPGTNIVAAQAQDYAGNLSAVVTRRFFYIVPSYFGLTIHGSGTVTGRTTIAGTAIPADGAMLNIGQNYTLTARPGVDYLLTNWTSAGFSSDATTLAFTMTPDLSIQANFVLSPFLTAPGPYNGLFFDTNNVTTQTAGLLSNLKVGALGAYTGRLLLGGSAYALAGAFDIYGAATNRFARPAARGGPFEAVLHLDWTSGEVSGAVSAIDGTWQSPLYGEAAITTSRSSESTMLWAASDNGAGPAPPGIGYVLITNRSGALTMSGALPDAAAFSQAVPLGKDGNAPFYQSLYAGGGLLLGWVHIANALPQAPEGLFWSRPAAPRSVFYPAGFSNVLRVAGSPWSNNITAQGGLVVSNTSVNTIYTVAIAAGLLSDTTDTPPIKGTINRNTGLMTLNIPSGRSSVVGYAAILANSTNIGGYFLTRTNTGVIDLQP